MEFDIIRRCYSSSMMLRPSLMVCMLPTLLVLAADKEPQYEMTTYVMGLFYKGPNWTAEETAETRRIQEGHLANFRKMADAGKLIVAGPFTDDGELRGVLIFKLTSVAEARTLMDADPAVKTGRLLIDLHPWLAA